eukprot:CAMPEP_0198138564 /NCGR_PEP_ID=MMETSP1443-20131203/1952_1 /TAXON_ID=186043 /ORGANISM="Entomoneis sp., Strain CCMP2396" /LENGTH=585 /DNA_ID=CAMNT_0043800381 /DNA_START=37 /DNA_END=1794 /DNA_ORIENTATION=+
MANEMLDEQFRNSHQDLQGMEVSTGKENKDVSFDMDDRNYSKSNVKQGMPTRKSVDFAILPQPKRTRPSPEWSLREALEAISISIGKEDRLQAIQKSRDTLAHEDQDLHDEELGCGADAVLTKHLAFLLMDVTSIGPECNATHQHGSINADLTYELSITLDALELIYRASSDAVGRSFKRVGAELVQILMKCLNRELDRRIAQHLVIQGDNEDNRIICEEEDEANNDNSLKVNQSEENAEKKEEKEESPPLKARSENEVAPQNIISPEGDTVIHKTTRILGHLARVGEATKPLAHFPGFLGTLLKLITLYPYERIPWEARLSALWTIANLGCNSKNMQMMVCTPGLVDAMIHVSCRNLHPGDSIETTVDILRGRSIASRCLLNLSWAPENKIVLGQQAALIDLLAELAVHRHAPLSKSRTVREILVTTRRHAIGALRNLAAAPRRSKILLCGYKNGHLLTTLTDAALNDSDQAVKDRAFAAINNLAIHDTAEQIVNHPALVMALKDVLLSAEEEERNHKAEGQNEEGTPKVYASATLLVLERSITAEMPAYQNLRELLDAVNPTTPTEDEESEEDTIRDLHATAV